jgi:hypothetical protein
MIVGPTQIDGWAQFFSYSFVPSICLAVGNTAACKLFLHQPSWALSGKLCRQI